MKRGNRFRGLIINDWFLDQPEIKELTEKEGAAGLGRLVMLAMELLHCDNVIGTEDDLRSDRKSVV